MNFYQKHILPKLLNVTCSLSDIEQERQHWIPKARGHVLEIGIGSGLNIPFYDKSKVSKVWGLDPSQELLNIASTVAKESVIDIELLNRSAANIPIPNHSMDYVVMTYTMCSISNITVVLREIKRVLKNNGTLLFCEHGKAPDSFIYKWQTILSPLWATLFGGCHLNKDILAILNTADFKVTQLKKGYLPKTPRIAGYNYAGLARSF